MYDISKITKKYRIQVPAMSINIGAKQVGGIGASCFKYWRHKTCGCLKLVAAYDRWLAGEIGTGCLKLVAAENCGLLKTGGYLKLLAA